MRTGMTIVASLMCSEFMLHSELFCVFFWYQSNLKAAQATTRSELKDQS